MRECSSRAFGFAPLVRSIGTTPGSPLRAASSRGLERLFRPETLRSKSNCTNVALSGLFAIPPERMASFTARALSYTRAPRSRSNAATSYRRMVIAATNGNGNQLSALSILAPWSRSNPTISQWPLAADIKRAHRFGRPPCKLASSPRLRISRTKSFLYCFAQQMAANSGCSRSPPQGLSRDLPIEACRNFGFADGALSSS